MRLTLSITLVVLAILSPFLFPWPFALVLAALASLFVPITALVVGVLVDLLYLPNGFPTFALIGILAAIFFMFVQQFVKTRIMS